MSTKLTKDKSIKLVNSEVDSSTGDDDQMACIYNLDQGGAIQKEILQQHDLCCAFKITDIPSYVTQEQRDAIAFTTGMAIGRGHPIASGTADVPIFSKYQRPNKMMEQRTGLTGLLVLPMFLKYEDSDQYFIDLNNTYVAISRERPYLLSNVNVEGLKIWEQVSMSSITELSHAMCRPRLSVVSA